MTSDMALSALGDSNRRRILQLLAGGPLPVHEILTHFDFSQPALSKHLRILRNAGLVGFERAGRTHHYNLQGNAVKDAADWLTELHAFWNQKLTDLGDLLDAQTSQPNNAENNA